MIKIIGYCKGNKRQYINIDFYKDNGDIYKIKETCHSFITDGPTKTFINGKEIHRLFLINDWYYENCLDFPTMKDINFHTFHFHTFLIEFVKWLSLKDYIESFKIFNDNDLNFSNCNYQEISKLVHKIMRKLYSEDAKNFILKFYKDLVNFSLNKIINNDFSNDPSSTANTIYAKIVSNHNDTIFVGKSAFRDIKDEVMLENIGCSYYSLKDIADYDDYLGVFNKQKLNLIKIVYNLI